MGSRSRHSLTVRNLEAAASVGDMSFSPDAWQLFDRGSQFIIELEPFKPMSAFFKELV
jgi:hypothetical protein